MGERSQRLWPSRQWSCLISWRKVRIIPGLKGLTPSTSPRSVITFSCYSCSIPHNLQICQYSIVFWFTLGLMYMLARKLALYVVYDYWSAVCNQKKDHINALVVSIWQKEKYSMFHISTFYVYKMVTPTRNLHNTGPSVFSATSEFTAIQISFQQSKCVIINIISHKVVWSGTPCHR